MTESEFQEFLITVGYRYNKKSKTAFNSFEGFHTMISFKENEKRYIVTLSSGVRERPKLDGMLKTFSAENKDFVIKTAYTDHRVEMILRMTVDSEIDREHLKEVSRFMTELYKSGCINPVCRICSRDRKTGIYVIGQELVPVCSSCITRKRRLYEKRRDMFDKKVQNMPAGIAGALFGAMLGASLYILLYQLFPSFGTTALLIVCGAFAGFVVTGNRATRKSAVICFIMSCVVFFAAEYASLVAGLAVLIEREGGGIAVTEAIQVTNANFADMNNISLVLPEILIGIAVMAAAGIVYFLKRNYTRPLTISKNIL